MENLRHLMMGVTAATYLLTGVFAGEYLLDTSKRESIVWRGTVTLTWPVIFITKVAAKMDQGGGPSCCKRWEGNV